MNPSVALITTIILIIICDAQVFADEAKTCKNENEEWTNCGGCSKNCDDGSGLVCHAACVEGCFCKSGFKKHPNGNCVPEDQCPTATGVCKDPNEEMREGDACSEACDRAVKLCQAGQSLGCYCKKGFLRDPNTKLCVQEDQCPELGQSGCCDSTKEYRCGNNCWDYCDDGALRKCSGDCKFGCYCKTGYKYNPKTNECVPPKKCPPIRLPPPTGECTGRYEVYKNGSACQDKCNKHLVRCADDTKPGCYCIDGYARDLETNACRPYPCEECGENAKWKSCAGSCDEHCDFVLGRSKCEIYNIMCPDGCRCKTGFARATSDPKSKCIEISKCV